MVVNLVVGKCRKKLKKMYQTVYLDNFEDTSWNGFIK